MKDDKLMKEAVKLAAKVNKLDKSKPQNKVD